MSLWLVGQWYGFSQLYGGVLEYLLFVLPFLTSLLSKNLSAKLMMLILDTTVVRRELIPHTATNQMNLQLFPVYLRWEQNYPPLHLRRRMHPLYKVSPNTRSIVHEKFT